MVFMKTGFLVMEGKRPRTCLQIKMAEEETHTRITEVENQMAQMVMMMAEMKAFILTSRGSYPTTQNVGVSNVTEILIKNPIRIKEPV